MFIRRDAIVEAFRLGVDEKPEWFLNLLETNRDLVYEVSGEEFKTYVSIRIAGAGPRRIATEGDWIVYTLGSLQIYKNDKFEELFQISSPQLQTLRPDSCWRKWSLQFWHQYFSGRYLGVFPKK